MTNKKYTLFLVLIAIICAYVIIKSLFFVHVRPVQNDVIQGILIGFGMAIITAQILNVPEMNGRYYSVQFTNPSKNTNFAYVGKRTTGNESGSYLICGPGWKGSVPEINRDATKIKSSVNGIVEAIPKYAMMQAKYAILWRINPLCNIPSNNLRLLNKSIKR